MKYKIAQHIVALMLTVSAPIFADQAWITDDLRTGVQSGPDRNADFAGTLVAGAQVERLEESTDGQYTKVRSGDLTGWVLSRNLSDKESIRTSYEQQTKALQEAQQSLAQLRQMDGKASKENRFLQQALVEAREQAQRSKDELLSFKRAAENVVEIDALNRELQDKVVRLEQANLRLTQQNTRLSEQSHHRQMMIGGALVLGGMVAFWLLGLLGGVRRRSTFNDF